MAKTDHPNDAPGVPMLMPPKLEELQIRYMNPVMRRLAPFVPGMAVVSHRGRKSGQSYQTVVAASRSGDVLSIGLMHGKTNWVKNILAAGGASVRLAGQDLRITNPRVVSKGDTSPELPEKVRRAAKRTGVFVADIA